MLCSNLMCSSKDTVLLSNLSLSNPEGVGGEDETVSLPQPSRGSLVEQTPPLGAVGGHLVSG